MRRLSLLLLSLIPFVILPSVVESQSIPTDTAPHYRLHVPMAEEYLEVIPAALTRSLQSVSYYQFLSILNSEVATRYGDNFIGASSSALYAAYISLKTAFPYILDHGQWINAIVLAWLRENQIDLATVADPLIVDDYHLSIQVTPQDFNADQIDEFVLRIEQEGERGYTVLRQIETGYQTVETPLIWYSSSDTYFLRSSGDIEPIRFEDLNYNGSPEWVLSEGGYGDNYQNHGELYIMEWQDGKIVDISPTGGYDPERATDLLTYSLPGTPGYSLTPDEIEWQFINLDHDSALEVTQRQKLEDNWTCVLWETRSFDWSASKDRYVISGRKYDYSESQGCALRFAQQAMWDGDTAAAIPLYEQSIAQGKATDLSQLDEYTVPNVLDKLAYAQARLAIAYALVGRDTDAAQLLQSVVIENIPEGHPRHLLEAMKAAYGDRNVFRLCAAAYDYFTTYNAYDDVNVYYGSTVNIVPGLRNNGEAPTSNPVHAGCDLPGLINVTLNWRSPSENQSPGDYLASLDMPVGVSLNFDLDNDGQQAEWLVWMDIPRSPAMLFDQDCHCGLLAVVEDLLPPSQKVEFGTVRLPNGETVLATTYYDLQLAGGGNEYWDYDFPYYICDSKTTNTSQPGRGYLRLYRTGHWHQFDKILEVLMCEPRHIKDFFSVDNTQLDGWLSLNDEYRTTRPSVYRWNSVLKTYEPEALPVSTPEIPSDASSVAGDTSINLHSVMSDDISLYESGEVDAAIELLEHMLPTISKSGSVPEDDLNMVRYYLGFLYEIGNRPDEALAEYISIYESAPDSAWGILAALHLEKVAQ